jgi:DNA-binding transcriptional LysR family regulator
MEIRELRYFLAVVRLGGFSAAAEQLGRTQQAVSKAIHQLEERLGVRLLDRDARTPRPTAFGELLLERAHEVDAALARFEADLAAMRGGAGEPVRWGASPAAASRVVSAAVLDVLRHRPGIRCTIRSGVDRELVPALARGELDLVVALHTTAAPESQVIAEVLGHEVYAVVAGRAHPLASQPHVRPAELAAQRWLYGLNLGDVESALAGAFDAHGLSAPVPAVESTSVEFGRAALASGEFVGVLPLALVEGDLAAGRLRRLRVPGFEWRRPLTLFRRHAQRMSPAALACLDALHRAAARHTSPAAIGGAEPGDLAVRGGGRTAGGGVDGSGSEA